MFKRWLIAGSMLLLLAGCGTGTPSTVKGKVSHNGKAVAVGTIIFVGPDNVQHPGNIEPDGSFLVLNVLSGPNRVAVISDEPLPVQPSEGRARSRGPAVDSKIAPAPPTLDRSKWFKLPDNFREPSLSGVTATVKPGENTIDIDLK